MLIMLTSRNHYYCKIFCYAGDNRSVYTYIINNEETKQYFTNGTNKYGFCTFARGFPEHYDDWENVEPLEFPTKIEFIKHAKQLLHELSNDTYDTIEIALPLNDTELKSELNLTDAMVHTGRSFWDKDIRIGYDYPINKCLIKKGIKKCKTSKKENNFMQICKEQLPDLTEQICIQCNNKNCYVDGYSPSNKIIIEFLGDYYHGNLDLYERNYYHKDLKKTSGQLFDEWTERYNNFIANGFNVIYIWENNYNQMSKKEIRQWLCNELLKHTMII